MISQKKPTSFIKEQLHAFGDFYMRNRKLFAVVKLVLLVGVMTLTFSTRTPSGKVVHHGVSTTYAGGSGICGNAICESTDANCQVRSTDCSKINTGSCTKIGGCTIKTTDVYSCAGTTFSCNKTTNKTACETLGCFWMDNYCTKDNGVKIASESCSKFSEKTTCDLAGGTIGSCSRAKTNTTQACIGTITTPTKESDCTTLSGLIISFGITAIRTPAYTEDSATCPQDCPAIVCGNGILEIGETCDDGANNSDVMPGACKKTCDGYVNATCNGTYFPMMCNQLVVPDGAKECSNYYSMMNNQCAYDSKNNICTEGSSCTVVVAAVCGNGSKEGSETCDDGANNGVPGKCNATCDGITPASVVCGNGIVEGDEACDDGEKNSYYNWCSPSCTNITPLCSGDKVSYCSQLDLNDPISQCGNYYDRGYQCQYDKNKLNDCTIRGLCSENTCGDGMVATTETCDDGANNGEPGKCNTTCDGYVTDTCSGIIVPSNKTCIELPLANPDKDCSKYYSINNAQCKYNTELPGTCIEGNSCVVPTSVCGNGEVEGTEICDDKNTTNGDGCSSTCELQEQTIPYTTGGEVTITFGDGVKYDSAKKWFYVPAGVSVFTFTDSGIALGYGEGKFVFMIPYTTTGDIDNISNSETIGWADSWDIFMISYKGSINYPVTGFTFTDSGINMQATWTGGSRDFSVKGTACIGTSIGSLGKNNCNDLSLADPVNECKSYYNSVTEQQCTSALLKGGGGYICREDRNNTCGVEPATACGDGKLEKQEQCDDGNKTNGDGCSSTCTIESNNACGDSIIAKGEMCDNGVNNGKPGQCNSTCNGWLAYNGSCGDKTCGSYCAIDPNATCDSLNANESTKNLCSTLGCFLQKTNIYNCAGTVNCEKITKSTMYNDQYMVGKYCNLAGCSYDGKSGLCTTPAKAPSCGNLPAAEYCKMLSPMGCNLTTDGVSTTCVGNTALRSDKLNQSQCTTMNGTWNTEDTSTCSTDCKVTCAANSTSDCGSINTEQCTNYYGGSANCIVEKGACTKGNTQCTTCGNNICDNNETYTTCPNDCNKGDWPSISYTPSIPKDGTLVSGPVTAKVTFGNGCTILNNNGSTSYTFNYNGYFIFKVSCPWLAGKTLDIGAKVYRLQNSAKEVANLSDISTTSGSTLYCENKNNLIGEVAANNTAMIEMAKKAIYEQSLTSSSSTLKSEFSDKVTISGNISFVNGANTLTKIELTKDLAGAGTKATLIIPANSTVKSENSKGQTSDFSGLFLAPTLANSTIVENLSEQIKNEENSNVAVVLKVGDEENTKLTVVDTGDEAQEFIITLELTGYKEGDNVEIFSSQEGNVWTSYGFATVNADGEVSFAVPHLTYYGIASEGGSNEDTTTPTPTGSNGGGGGGSSINQCTADRDCKNSYLITVCGACTEAEKVAEIKVKQNSVVCYNYSSELNGAYSFAYANAITTIADCEKANLNGKLLRSHMAKMMSNFAVNTLGLKPNTGTVCEFTDMDNETAEMKFYAKLACQLGLMGLDTDGKANTTFTPNEVVTRAQFGTVLSRLLRGTKNNGGKIYYQKHLQALKDADVMTKIDTPSAKELRGWTMLMMQRITNKVSPAENGDKTLWELIQEFFAK